jgi:hypothetical protein
MAPLSMRCNQKLRKESGCIHLILRVGLTEFSLCVKLLALRQTDIYEHQYREHEQRQ